MLGALLMSHTGSHTGELSLQKVWCLPMFSPQVGPISDHRHQRGPIIIVCLLTDVGDITLWSWVSLLVTHWNSLPVVPQVLLRQCRNDAAITSRLQICFLFLCLSIQTRTLLGKLCLVSWHLQVSQPYKNFWMKRITTCPLSWHSDLFLAFSEPFHAFPWLYMFTLMPQIKVSTWPQMLR